MQNILTMVNPEKQSDRTDFAGMLINSPRCEQFATVVRKLLVALSSSFKEFVYYPPLNDSEQYIFSSKTFDSDNSYLPFQPNTSI